MQGRVDPGFHVVYAKFCPDYLSVAAEMETQTWQRFSNFLLSNFGYYVQL